jgi:hypothetical protein
VRVVASYIDIIYIYIYIYDVYRYIDMYVSMSLHVYISRDISVCILSKKMSSATWLLAQLLKEIHLFGVL